MEGDEFGGHLPSSTHLPMSRGSGRCFSADDVVPLASFNNDRWFLQGRFAAECEVAGMKISTSKSDAMVLSWERVNHPL